MRTCIFGLALLGAAVSAPASAQTSPATPDRAPPAAATQNSTGGPTATTRPPAATEDRSGTTSVGPRTEGGQPAVRVDDGTRTAATPQPGANSFTEGQARSRIEAAGFSDVTELQKDDQGIWRGQGKRNGQQVGVALDFQGNVTSR